MPKFERNEHTQQNRKPANGLVADWWRTQIVKSLNEANVVVIWLRVLHFSVSHSILHANEKHSFWDIYRWKLDFLADNLTSFFSLQTFGKNCVNLLCDSFPLCYHFSAECVIRRTIFSDDTENRCVGNTMNVIWIISELKETIHTYQMKTMR